MSRNINENASDGPTEPLRSSTGDGERVRIEIELADWAMKSWQSLADAEGCTVAQLITQKVHEHALEFAQESVEWWSEW